ncbi:MAG: carboxypeptidase M32 [Nitrospirae bacterium]|nr:MAG: carboxypeptidase M32 [Nitrospirota bacterium]
MTLTPWERLKTTLRDIHHLKDAAAVLSWDQETYMPPGASHARAEHLATLQTVAHRQFVSPEMEELLATWLDPETGQLSREAAHTLDAPAQALLRETWRDFHRAKKLPSSFVTRLEREVSLAQHVWAEAKRTNDFPLFLPHLRTLIALKLEEAAYLGYRDSPYDALLDTYEPGMTEAEVSRLFAALRPPLMTLLEQVLASPVRPDPSIIVGPFEASKQLAFGRMVLECMGYDFRCGRLDLSAHPFTTSFHPTDVRVTTRVDEHDLFSCLFGCIHEGGHALYDQGLPVEHYGTPLAEPISLGIHESQSRLWENCVGRSRPFWRHFYPRLQTYFPDQLKAVSLDEFYAVMNRVCPSLIRVEADELTYNLHIMLRFELERDLLKGEIPVEELPAVWNQKMDDYLGIRPQKDSEGVLQDVHWSMGAFGYFPTYTLGNLYAAMLYEQACREIPDWNEHVVHGDLLPLKAWLNRHVHRWGRQYPAHDLIQRITGQSPTPGPFLRYLTKKFGDLYGIPIPSEFSQESSIPA